MKTIARILLILALTPRALTADKDPTFIVDKTLVAWVSPANLTQQGGSALTLDDQQSHFDAIVFGECAPARWMAGSDFFSRTEKEQAHHPSETADAKTRVQVAIVYQGNRITIYRDAREYVRYEIAQPQKFGPDCVVLMGLRHLEAGPFELRADEPLKLRVFVDKSVVEAFANGRQAVMRRIYPSRPDSVGVKLFSRGDPAQVTSLEAWEMAASNPY